MKDSTFSQYFSSQSPNFFYSAEHLPNLHISCFEGGSLDARNFQQLSEDFFAYQYQNNVFCMVLCDGVGQTKDAELAANLFGKKILGYLPAVNGKKEYLEKISYDLRSVISDEIDLAPLSEDAPGPHKYARQNQGAQVKFACSVIDFNRNILEVYWAGDVRFVVYGKNKKITKSVSVDNKQFWSTKSNYALNLEYFSVPIESSSRISITSDGIRENINNILAQKIYLDDINLAKRVYQKGVDDISGIDVKISAKSNLKHLPAVKDVQIVGRTLSWYPVSGVENYRIYLSTRKKVEFLANIGINENSYIIPQDIDFDEVFIQAISSNAISSELLKATAPVKQDIFRSIPKLPDPIISPQPPYPNLTQENKKIELHPNRFWLIFSSLMIFVCMSIIASYSFFNFVNSATPTPTFTLISSPTETVIINTMTISPSFTPIYTETITQTPDSLVETTPDTSVLDNCQQGKYLLDPQKYQNFFYRVQPNDNLISISEIYLVSVEDIKQANCKNDDEIVVGEYLLIPQNP